jgi:sec-independent protein translocase protein TatA
MFAGLGSPVHLLIILLIILLLFGTKRLPEMGRSLGQGIQEFKEGLGNKDASQEERRIEAVEEGGRGKVHAKAAQNEAEEEERPHEKGT